MARGWLRNVAVCLPGKAGVIMKIYRTLNRINIPGGTRVMLSKKQLRGRLEKLKKVGKSVYFTLGAIQFKAGDMVGLESVPKILKSSLEEVKQ